MFPPSRECWRSWLLPPRPAASRLKPRSESLPVERAGPAGAFGGDFGLHLRRYFEANFDWYRTTAAVLSHIGWDRMPPLSRLAPMRALRQNKNVGGAGHDCGMSNPQTTGAGICPALRPWFLTEAPLAGINPQAPVR